MTKHLLNKPNIQFFIYQNESGVIKIEVRLKNETVSLILIFTLNCRNPETFSYWIKKRLISFGGTPMTRTISDPWGVVTETSTGVISGALL
jgi:uncharacterized membrane-anchored protein